MSHKRGRDKRANDKRKIRALDRQDLDRFRNGDYMTNTALFVARRLKMRSFYMRLP